MYFRIGRTGRCGNTGRSTSFYDEIDDAPLAPALVKTLSDAQQEVILLFHFNHLLRIQMGHIN